MKRQIEDIIKERIRIANETYSNWYDGIERCWTQLIDILSADAGESIDYFLHECTDEEFFWLSEIFEEIVEKTQSRELVSALRARLAQVTPEKYDRQSFKSEHMRNWIGYAEYVKGMAKEINYAENKIDG